MKFKNGFYGIFVFRFFLHFSLFPNRYYLVNWVDWERLSKRFSNKVFEMYGYEQNIQFQKYGLSTFEIQKLYLKHIVEKKYCFVAKETNSIYSFFVGQLWPWPIQYSTSTIVAALCKFLKNVSRLNFSIKPKCLSKKFLAICHPKEIILISLPFLKAKNTCFL